MSTVQELKSLSANTSGGIIAYFHESMNQMKTFETGRKHWRNGKYYLSSLMVLRPIYADFYWTEAESYALVRWY